MPDEFHFMPDKFHLMPEPTNNKFHVNFTAIRLLNERSFSMIRPVF
jgi:hypothetical protein